MYFDPPIKTSVIPLSNDVLPVSIQLIQMRGQQSACAGTVTVTSVLFYFASTWWKFPQKLSSQWAPACFSGADIDRRAVAVWVAGVRLLPLGCSNAPSSHSRDLAEVRQRSQTPRLYTSWFPLWLYTNRHCRCLLKCFYVVIRPAAQQWTAPSPWCWAPHTETVSNDTFNASY